MTFLAKDKYGRDVNAGDKCKVVTSPHMVAFMGSYQVDAEPPKLFVATEVEEIYGDIFFSVGFEHAVHQNLVVKIQPDQWNGVGSFESVINGIKKLAKGARREAI